MAGMTHLGVGLAAKKLAPEIPLLILVIGSYAIDIIWGVFYFLGIEYYPTPEVVRVAPWSHGLFMAIVWSVLIGLTAFLIGKKFRTGLFFGLLVFSHWIVDFIAKPMLYSFPTDSGLPLFFEGSPVVGLGLWSTQIGQNIGEYGVVLLGLVIYVLTLVKLKKEKRSSP